jgi:hypothetical protein
MTRSVEVIIGRHGDDDAHRDAARGWVARWYAGRGYTVTTGTASGDVWCKADAYNPAVAASTADIVVLADADSFPDADALAEAVGMADRLGWAAPFDRVRRLSYDATMMLLDCDPAATGIPPDRRLEADVHDVLPGGGVVVMRRDLALACGPYDPRFIGWGGEDFALGNTARTLCGSYAAVVPGLLWHLWHPRKTGMSQQTRQLADRYRRAKFDGAATRSLIDEWNQA